MPSPQRNGSTTKKVYQATTPRVRQETRVPFRPPTLVRQEAHLQEKTYDVAEDSESDVEEEEGHDAEHQQPPKRDDSLPKRRGLCLDCLRRGACFHLVRDCPSLG